MQGGREDARPFDTHGHCRRGGGAFVVSVVGGVGLTGPWSGETSCSSTCPDNSSGAANVCECTAPLSLSRPIGMTPMDIPLSWAWKYSSAGMAPDHFAVYGQDESFENTAVRAI